MVETVSRTRNWMAVLPLVLFLLLAAVLYVLLVDDRQASELPSALIDKPAPRLELAGIEGLELDGKPVPGFDPAMFEGRLSVVNVFASWCVPCRQEHPQMLELAELGEIQMIGLNHKDNRANALGFLAELGNPYDRVGVDRQGRASIEWGVYGVPETFLVGPDGNIFHKHVGPVSKQQLDNILLPLLRQRMAAAQ